ncbi:proteasome stabiliser-domain-containing protein [Dunaliella salina]|uniref:Proteasome stabiliser-domain-containing protein n=1 Tax=Dunaliella salina TaxID=3046 RepID=A0ABQ7GCK2_DUNSA|nr:proteasome stabiliser-domain-containing protein [Dunaliella salina]|eukprot:KAF5832303.1 proteasome stabiliser-domain-containing protein [Dunaliella salina]
MDQQTAQQEVAGLDRVLTRLAMTDDEKLESVLHKLIPAVLGTLKSPHDATRKKVLEIMAHVNKRVKGHTSLKLPLSDLAQLTHDANPMVRSFALVYCETAMERASKAERLAAVGPLLLGVGGRAGQQKAMCLRLAMAGLEGLESPSLPATPASALPPQDKTPPSPTPGGAENGNEGVPSPSAPSTPAPAAAAIGLPGAPDARGAAWAAAVQRYPFLGRDEDRAAFLGFAMKLMLLVPRTVNPAQLQAQQQQQQLPGSLRILGFHPPPPPTPAAPPPPPPGLSDADLESLMDKVPAARQQSTTQAQPQVAGSKAGMELPSGEPLVKRKLGILNFLEGARLPPREILLLLVVAACDPYDAVSKRGEELQKKLCSTDGTRPAVNLEQEEGVLRDAFALFHGNASGVALNAAVPEGQRVQPASPAVRSRLLSLFCKSVAAANMFPQTITTIQEAVFGSGSSVRLKQQGMEFSVWVCKHAAHTQLKAMAPAVLQGLLGTLERGGDLAASPDMVSSGAPLPTDRTSVTLRGFAYQATGALVQRVPESLAGRIDVAHRFFAALSAEPPGLRATVAEAASCLSAAFKADTLTPQQASELNDLLLTSIGAHQDALRLCAVQWANRLFPLDHVQARWICVLAASDTKLEVRDEGARGLRLSPINLAPLEPSPLMPTPSVAAPLSHSQVAGTAAAVAPGSAPESAAGGEGREAMVVDGAVPAADKAKHMMLAPPPERRPDLVALLRYAAGRVPALLPPRAFGGPPVPPAGAAAAAAATQRAQGGGGPQGMMDWQAGEGGGKAMNSSEGAATADPVPMPDPARVLPVKPRCLLLRAMRRHAICGEQLPDRQADLEHELLDVVTVVPEECEARFSSRVSWLCGFLAHVDPSARAAAAKLVGVASAAMESQAAQQLLTTLISGFGTTPAATGGAASSAHAASPAAAATASISGRAPAAAPPKFETQEGSILAAGCVLFHCLRGQPPLSPTHAQPSASALLTAALSHPTPLMASTAALSIALCSLSNTPLQALLQPQAEEGPSKAAPPTAGTKEAEPHGGGAAPVAAPAAAPGGAAPVPPAAAVPTTGATDVAPTTAAAPSSSGGGASQQPAAAAVTGAQAAADAMRSRVAKEAETEAAEEADRTRLDTVVGEGLAALVRRILTLMGDRDVKVGRVCTGLDAEAASGGSGGCNADPLLLRVLLRGLLKLSPQKNEEIVFAAGEALAYVVGSVPVSREQVLRSNFTSLADEFALLTSTGTPAAPPAPPAAAGGGMEVDGASPQEGGPNHAAACSASRAAVQEELLQRLLDDMVVHSRAEVRCAAAVWLVSLLTYCGRHPALLPRLSEIQEALGGLLGDANELTQEMASRGVSMVYALGDTLARSKLVESLVGVLQGTNSRAAKVKLQGDTRVFEEGAIGNAPGGGSLSTYQELCSMATEVGQPDLVYKFMDLAHHQQALNTKRGAAFGFAGIARLVAGEALKPHVQRLLPRLYRYQYDPNPRVQEAMSGIWKALVDDPKAALDAALPTLMHDLTQELGGRLWRNRQAAAAALADLLQGRRWNELAPHITTLWMMTFRAMDDIKESVRNAASILARSLRGVTLRLVDASLSPPADAAAAVAMVLPFMIEHGLNSTVTEVRVLALDIISQTARSASPAALKPLLPALVQAMLEGLSSLEDSRLNYLEQHAERLGMDADRLDSARTSAARASPLGETLDLCARVAGSDPSEGGALETLLPTVANIIRHGVGLNTKVGAARFARSLTSRAGSAMRAHAPPLLKALTSATRAERSNTVRKAYAGAAALICRYAAPKRVEWFVNTAVEMHKGGSGSSEGGGGDKDARYAAGLLLRELLRSAPEAFAAQAASEALPLAFGAKMDEDTDVAAVWKEVWEEGSSSEAGAVRLYAPEIVALLVEGLGSQQWGRKQASAQAVVRLTELGHDLLNGSASPTGPAEGAHAGGVSSGGSGSSSPACVLAVALLSEAGGRLWDGKEAVLQALAALAKSAPAALSSLRNGGHARVVEAALAGTQRRKASFR